MVKTVMSPCFRYLIRHAAKNEKDLLRFAKFFFALMSSRGIDDDNAAIQYSLLLSCLTGMAEHVDILSYKGERLNPTDFRKRVMADDSIDSVSDCYSYCFEILGDNSICRICPSTNACSYVNENEENEYKILRFIHESADNLKYFKEHKKPKAVVFKSEIDLAAELPYDYPVVVSIAKECCYKIVSKTSKISTQHYSLNLPLNERLENLKPGTRMPLVKQDARVDELCQINPSVVAIAWAEASRKILAAPLIKKEELSRVMGNDFRNKKGEGKATDENFLVYLSTLDDGVDASKISEADSSSTPLLAEAMAEMENMRDVPFEDEPSEVSADNSTGVIDEEYVPSEDMGSEYSDADIYSDSDIYGIGEEMPFEESEPAAASDDNADTDEKPFSDEGAAEGSPVAESVAEEPADANGSFADDAEEDDEFGDDWFRVEDEWAVAEEDTSGDNVPETDDTDAPSGDEGSQNPPSSESSLADEFDPYNSPIILSLKELFDIAEPFKEVPETDVHMKKISVEVVYAEGEYYMLFYFRKCKKAFYAPFKNTDEHSLESAKGLLSARSKVLITYQPYYLYSLCRIHGYRIRNVYSIFSADRVIFDRGGKKVMGAEEILSFYAKDRESEWIPGCSAKERLSYMSLYRYIKALQGYMLEQKSAGISDIISYYDQLMGLSYLDSGDRYNRLFFVNDETSMFTFERVLPSNYGKDSIAVTYEITKGNPQVFLFECLLKLIPDMKMQLCGYYLYSVEKKKFTVMIPAAAYELTTDLIEAKYNAYAHEHPTEEFIIKVTDR